MGQFFYKVLRSFKYALVGIWSACSERNMKVHLFAAVVVVWLGLILGLSEQEWFTVTLLIAAVFSAEMFNTAIEELCNIVRDELKLNYKATQRARDVAAGAVLVVAIAAAVIGAAIFSPKLFMVFLQI